MLCLRAAPESQLASTWIQDVNTAKLLLESSFTNYALASRCLSVINQLLPYGSLGSASDWSPAQLDIDILDTGLESWFPWPNADDFSLSEHYT
jgi:hypothetical protein